MSLLVVDASVVVKWFAPEIHSDEAAALLESGHQFLAPEYVFAEAANAFWKKVRRQELEPETALEILRIIPTLPLRTTDSATLLQAAFEIAVRLNRTVYDALYLALAVRERARLVTDDRRFHTAVQASALAEHCVLLTDPELRDTET